MHNLSQMTCVQVSLEFKFSVSQMLDKYGTMPDALNYVSIAQTWCNEY